MGFRPWALDFTPDDAGNPPFPFNEIINPYQLDPDGNDAFLEWTTGDWDPALRYWTLPYDPQLRQWLTVVDQTKPSIMAGREFGGHPELWLFDREGLIARGWAELGDFRWLPDVKIRRNLPDEWAKARKDAFQSIRSEIEQLQMLMQDDRDRYLAEIEVQSDGLPGYFIALIGASLARYPWTIELINCGLAIGNVAAFYYKGYFKRVRPSVVCPGLIPPYGPPAHPAFPSGHSFLGHFISLLLLEIPAIRQRYGIFASGSVNGDPGRAVDPNPSGPEVSITAGTVDATAHGLRPYDEVSFVTTGKLPSPLKTETPYYVMPTGLTADKFQISETIGGSVIPTTRSGSGRHSFPRNPLWGAAVANSPMLWFAQRQAKNRERLGVHYASDSSVSRHLAAAIWRALLHDTGATAIDSPTLKMVLRKAQAEWDTKWP